MLILMLMLMLMLILLLMLPIVHTMLKSIVGSFSPSWSSWSSFHQPPLPSAPVAPRVPAPLPSLPPLPFIKQSLRIFFFLLLSLLDSRNCCEKGISVVHRVGVFIASSSSSSSSSIG